MVGKIFRALIALVAGAGGAVLVYKVSQVESYAFHGYLDSPLQLLAAYAVFTVLFAFIGFIIAPLIIRLFVKVAKTIESLLTNMPASDLLGACVGVIVGLFIATMFQRSFSSVPYFGAILSVIVSLLLGYVGMMVGVKRKGDIWNLVTIIPRVKAEKTEKQKEAKKAAETPVSKGSAYYKVLDTSVIIDGRIADIVKTGFMDGILLVPSFVLDELRHVADSSDLLKRNRGRRGLDILNEISHAEGIPVEISEKDFDDVTEVDSKLVRLAQSLNCPILTNDYNLNKVAELQGVKVLNINELANSLKPVVLPGEEMYVQIMREGKEASQGVAYLDDGTMIVVDGGRRYIGQQIPVLVTTVLQTAAGRMIFARPKREIEQEALAHGY
ncbi:MAG: PIN/TRAM domain-containing protein [Gracilibacteraceae bacterium]|nr:PIN/TRAM domain-containing protein [Gracilibacteraceae bacterium]